jgi:hypothetical protein
MPSSWSHNSWSRGADTPEGERRRGLGFGGVVARAATCVAASYPPHQHARRAMLGGQAAYPSHVPAGLVLQDPSVVRPGARGHAGAIAVAETNVPNAVPFNNALDPTHSRVTALAWQGPRRGARGSALR